MKDEDGDNDNATYARQTVYVKMPSITRTTRRPVTPARGVIVLPRVASTCIAAPPSNATQRHETCSSSSARKRHHPTALLFACLKSSSAA